MTQADYSINYIAASRNKGQQKGNPTQLGKQETCPQRGYNNQRDRGRGGSNNSGIKC